MAQTSSPRPGEWVQGWWGQTNFYLQSLDHTFFATKCNHLTHYVEQIASKTIQANPLHKGVKRLCCTADVIFFIYFFFFTLLSWSEDREGRTMTAETSVQSVLPNNTLVKEITLSSFTLC